MHYLLNSFNTVYDTTKQTILLYEKLLLFKIKIFQINEAYKQLTRDYKLTFFKTHSFSCIKGDYIKHTCQAKCFVFHMFPEKVHLLREKRRRRTLYFMLLFL